MLEEKAKRLEEAKGIYLDVVTYQSPEWATAALLRIGQGYEAYAKAMRNAPVPKDLKEEEKQVYRDELEKVVVVIEDKALDALQVGLRARCRSASTTSTRRPSARRSRASPRTSTRRRPSCARRSAWASRASRSSGSRRCGVTTRRLALRWTFVSIAGALGAGAALAGCGSHAASHGQSARPTAPVALPRANPEAQAEFDQGVVVMKMGRKHYKEARQHFTKATKLDGKLFEAWHDLGVVETALGNYDKAVDDFEKALDVQPGSRKTILAYGESLRRAHRPQKAAKVYAKWLDSDPNDAEMRSRYGQVLREAGDLEESLEQARQLLAQGSSGENVAQTVIAYNALGLTYYKMGKLDLAETAFRKAADLDAKSAFVWNNLGLVAFDRGHDQEAFLNFQKASELDPKYVQARLNKAVVYLDCGDYKHAREELVEAVRIDPNDAEAQVALGVAARGDGKLDVRGAPTSARSTSSDDYAPALFNLGVLYMDFDKDKTKAKDFLTQYTQSGDATDAKRQEAQARLKELQ